MRGHWRVQVMGVYGGSGAYNLEIVDDGGLDMGGRGLVKFWIFFC